MSQNRVDFLSKQDLEVKSGSQLAWFEYFQVSHLYRNLTLQGKIKKELTSFERLMSADSLPIKGLLSNIYCILTDRDLTPPLACKRAWELDLGRSIPAASWDLLWNSALHSSRNINVSMLTYKILYRWHLTPHRLHKINGTVSDRCWKGCCLLGSFIHCFWSCPRLQPFWRQVISQINIIAEISLPNDPAGIVLNIWQNIALDPWKKELVGLLLCAARSLIAQFWKSCKIPLLSD